MREKGDEDEYNREHFTQQELAEMDALDALWNSPEVQREMYNLARYGSPYAPGEEPDEGSDDAGQVEGMRRDALDGSG